MQLELEAKAVAGSAGPEENFVVDALDAVNLKFVSSAEEIESSAAFSPEYAHQHFGETEKIFGYQNLDVTVLYTDATLYLTSLVKYDTKINGNSTIKCDDIDYKIKDCLPSTQLEAFLTFEKFKQKLGEQKKFRPFGTLIGKFQHTNPEGQAQQFELYKFEKEENEPRLEEGLKFLERAQALAFWYIDAVSYTDEQDPRFFNYFLFEASSSTEDGLPRYKFAGYANLYRFYHHPNQSRVRIAQMLLAPPYRGAGLGHQFLQAFYTDLWTDESIYDITAETPADAFVYMRDYADCLNCSRLPQFSQVNLQKGFTPDKWEEARRKYKLNKAQTRRAYEILRLFHTNMNVPAERAQFKAEIIRRLKKLVMDPKKDGGRLSKVLAGDEQSMAIASMALDPEQQSQQLETLYDGLLVDYRNVLDRLVKYEKNFIH